jgi:ERCC4-type nuclease
MWNIVADKGREAPIAYLEEHSIYPLTIKQITVGDYAICYDETIKIIIERKTWLDLADSIKDPERRANHQKLLDLRAETNCIIMYFIEGTFNANKCGKMPIRALQGYLDHALIVDNCHILYTSSIGDTAMRILDLCSSCTTLPTENNDRVTNLGLLNKKYTMTPDTSYEKMWQCISGVTCVSYPIISKVCTIKDCIRGNVSLSTLSDLKYISGNILGLPKAKKICDSATKKHTHIKILSCIPGITTKSATYILAHNTMAELLDMTVEQLAALHKTDKLTVNKKVAVKLYEALNYTIV